MGQTLIYAVIKMWIYAYYINRFPVKIPYLTLYFLLLNRNAGQ